MGNKETYHYVDEQEEDRKDFPKAYDILLNTCLKCRDPTSWKYATVCDLRNGKPTWRLNMQAYGTTLKFGFWFLKTENNVCIPYHGITLQCKDSKDTITVLTGKSVKMELYSDNIHHQKLNHFGLKFFVVGFVKLDHEKIPIALTLG